MKITGKIVDIFARSVYNGEIILSGTKIDKILKVDEAPDIWILPGLIDAHVHIESSMVTPSHFAVAAVKHGTVGLVSDPHEIANVLGVEGIKFMIENSRTVPVRFVFGAPSCVPATSFESSGSTVGAEEIRSLFREKGIHYLAEMMNFPGVIHGDATVLEKLKIAREAGVPVDGHAPGLTGEDLRKYVAAGITTDHECSTLEEALEKISLGMKILVREGSAAKNLNSLAALLQSHPEMVMLCSDDMHPETLQKGHINKTVARLIADGYDIFNVIRAATLNPSVHYSINSGMLRPGDTADFIVVDDPGRMNVLQTWIDGRCVYDGKQVLFSPGEVKKLNRFKCTRILAGEIKVQNRGGEIRAIKAFNGELLTASETVTAGRGPFVEARPGDDLLKLVVKERYNDAPPAVGFIKGFGLRKGAFATSVAHDSHNIIAVGADDNSIATAINMIVSSKGGMSVFSDEGSEILSLPVAGIMSDMPVSAMAARYERLSETVKSLGCTMDAPYMTLSFMALLVIPELKLSDRGLFDGKTFTHVPLFI